MKAVRYKRVLGLAIGEQSLMVAELTAGEPPRVRRLAEMPYPADFTVERIAELGPTLARFLRDHDFTARAAVVGIPARWLVVKPKEVPTADAATLAPLLRLQAEVEFSSELKDLVYDYADGPRGDDHNVLLVATTRRHVVAVTGMCEAARIEVLAVIPSAVALGQATGRAMKKDAVVLSVGSGGAELTTQRGLACGAIRALNSHASKPPFSELRRVMMSLGPGSNGREMFVWDSSGLDTRALGTTLGFTVHGGELAALGLEVEPDSLAASAAVHCATNGQTSQYAPAVALALSAVSAHQPALDFLHSRLAPPRARRIPRWAVLATIAGLLLISVVVWGYLDLHWRSQTLDLENQQLDRMKGTVDKAADFVAKVSFAQQFHGGDPRYLACLRDLTRAIPDDGQTYLTNLSIDQVVARPAAGGKSARLAPPRTLTGRIFGKTIDDNRDQGKVLAVQVGLRSAGFTDVRLLNSTQSPRDREWSFAISFSYEPPKTSGADAAGDH